MHKRKLQRAPKTTMVMVFFFQPHHPRTTLCRSATQQHTATAAALVDLSCTGLPYHSRRIKCPFLGGTANKDQDSQFRILMQSSALNNMFKVAAMIFRQIITELNGADT
jgi:hypothetical protein